MLQPELAEGLLNIIGDPARYGVPELNFKFWRLALAEVREAYLQAIRDDPEERAFLDERHLAGPIDFPALAKLPEGTLGRTYHDHLVANGLDYRLPQMYAEGAAKAEAAGLLEGVPDDIKYSTMRGFQLHDFQHVVTGYDTTPAGEIALQAFGLAQTPQVYAGVWMSVVTARLTFLDPDQRTPMMDAIADGWTKGRRSRKLHHVRWEEMLDCPVEDLRREYLAQ